MKKIAVPVLGGRFSSHFGGAEAFAVYQADEATKTIADKVIHPAPPHAQGSFPAFLAQIGADVIIAQGMGPRAVQILESNGIEVVLGAMGEDPDALVTAYLEGTLAATGESCHEHGHGHGGHCGH
jgi:predicted Fe-Mo cluster-binding NifX family protein